MTLLHRFAGTLEGDVARCESVSDVAAALAHARERGVGLSSRSGGDGVVVDLTRLNGIVIDPLRRIAWVQPGVSSRELDAATQEHGLAVTGCRAPGTGVAAFTLGAGSGWLERKLGLASDNLRAARVLTAGGRVVTASATENADLFWALRGGGTGFGIALELELALRPVGPEVLGGTLAWPRERAGEVARSYRDLMAEAPDALCGALALDGDEVAVLVLYTGDPERSAGHLAPLRALGPATDTVAPMSYCAFQSLMGGHRAPSAFLDYLPDPAIDALAAGRSPVLLQPLGGAFGRVGEMETAAGHRGAAWRVQGAELAPWSRPAADAERLARLAEVKRRWDPEQVFV
jgi:FAD binding domain